MIDTHYLDEAIQRQQALMDELVRQKWDLTQELDRARTIAGRLAQAVIMKSGAIRQCLCCGAHVFDPMDEARLVHESGCAVEEWRRSTKGP